MLPAQTYMHINNVVVDSGLILLQYFEESVHVFTGGEELQVGLKDLNKRIKAACQHIRQTLPVLTRSTQKAKKDKECWYLLKDVSSCRSPACYRVCGGFAVDVGLRVDGEDSSSVHLLQLGLQQVGLWGQRLIVPWQTHHLAEEEACDQHVIVSYI